MTQKERARRWYLKNAEYQKLKQRNRSKFNIANRICLDCAKKLKPEEHRRCNSCKTHRDDYRKNRVVNGLCWWCGKKKEDPKKIMCLECRLKRNRDRVKRFRENKLLAVNLLGEKCSMCGYKTNVLDVYDLHHIDPLKKGLESRKRIVANLSGEAMISEIKKCILVCANCHRIIHANEGI